MIVHVYSQFPDFAVPKQARHSLFPTKSTAWNPYKCVGPANLEMRLMSTLVGKGGGGGVGRIYQEPIFLMYSSSWSELFLNICTSLVAVPDLIVVSIVHTIKRICFESGAKLGL